MSARKEKARNQQLTSIWSTQTLAVHYGKPELAASLRVFAKELEADSLVWDPDADSGEEDVVPAIDSGRMQIHEMLMLLGKVGVTFLAPKDEDVIARFLVLANHPHSLKRSATSAACECGLVHGQNMLAQFGRLAQREHRADIIRLEAAAKALRA